ncbi:hypothetical protein EDC01DRAFT_622573 [Geopyxis carbonaria]|nr:hypothetical protein EDC01DRAFT_622573 [Geopyxis carbonaria]
MCLKGSDKDDRPQQRQLQHSTPLPLPQLEGNTRKKPLSFVDLPVDVLKDIVKEVTHTNDLTNLCLTCRCLHHLAVPQIYSRFDIVWPDTASTGERIGVDALTHGLATLTNVTKRGNDHARWVKKFSLGNGPADWVNEYNINKEGGKMLGTLVNLAITRMECLETFSWDMPTGILRDIFMSLHDLNGSLKNVHVRFHDNRETTPPSSHDPSRRVESPTFKGFKNLRCLSVLDIDERAYLEEMSYAVEQSIDRLKELRIGIAMHTSVMRRWIRDWDDLENTSPSGSAQEGAIGGVLGIVVSRIVNLEEGRKKRKTRTEETTPTPVVPAVAPVSASEATTPAVETAEAVVMTSAAPASVYVNPLDVATTASADGNPAASVTDDWTPPPHLSIDVPPPVVSAASPVQTSPLGEYLQVTNAGSVEEVSTAAAATTASASASNTVPPASTVASPSHQISTKKNFSTPRVNVDDLRPPKQLKLETFALERVPISVSILVSTRAIDWSVLQNLTILGCYNHERLWKALRRRFSPFTTSTALAANSQMKPGQLQSALANHRVRGVHGQAPGPSDFKIRLRKLHTDCVTPHLIYFIRDTLPPNSLEILFLQETTTTTNVTMDSIFKGAIRKHKGSLKKLLIDSKNHDETGDFYKWVFGKELLSFVSSGKMPNLRELGMAIEHKDWHYFLTRLPYMQKLRSLYITHIRDSPHISNFAPRELANQILNTVILRPEIELCYLGVLSKCFEILEGPYDESDPPELDGATPTAASGVAGAAGVESDEEEDSDVDEDEEDEDDLADEDEGAGDETESESGFAEEEAKRTGIRLREILFYDDKVEVFRARNARL